MKPLTQRAYQLEVKTDFSNASATYSAHADVQHKNYKCLADYAAISLQAIPTHSLAIDIGSGPGTGLGLFQQHCQDLQWLALDVSESMLLQHDSAEHKIVADMQQLPIASNSMALVLSSFAMHWSLDIEKSFQEAFRVLNTAGLAIFSFPVLGSFKLLEKVWLEQGLQSPLHPMPDQIVILDFLRQQGCHYSYQLRTLPLDLWTTQDCFQWLKYTGVRHKKRSDKKMTKKQYLGIVNSLTDHFEAGETLGFDMMDVFIQKRV